MNTGKPARDFAQDLPSLCRLDYLPAWLAITLGTGAGVLLGVLLFQTSPLIAEIGFVMLLGGALALARSGEPIAVPVGPKPPPPSLVEMVEIPAGVFLMGGDEYESEKPIHEVHLSAFKCMRFPVTRKLYQEIIGKDPGWPAGETDERPVNNVSWYDTIEFCNRLSEREGLLSCYRRNDDGSVSWDQAADGYRLLTEAEWEYACRAGTRTRYSFGDDEGRLGEYAWYSGNTGNRPQPVGTRQPNPWGLHDMHGNVWEWCWDWYGAYSSEPQVDPVGPSAGNARVLREGGVFGGRAVDLCSALRNWYWPGNQNVGIGFRCARGPRRQP